MPIYIQTPANPLGSTTTSAPSVPSSVALTPLVYWYGHPEIHRNQLLLDRLIRNLGENVSLRHDSDPHGAKLDPGSYPEQLSLLTDAF